MSGILMRMSSASCSDKLVAQVKGYPTIAPHDTRDKERTVVERACTRFSIWREEKGFARIYRETVEISTVVLSLPCDCFSARAIVRVARCGISHQISSTRSQISVLDRRLNAYLLLRPSLRFCVWRFRIEYKLFFA